jgi:flagellar biosynthetic protein FliR
LDSYATAAQVYVAGLVFARVGAMVMLMPGIGDNAVPQRIRLSFALLMSMILAPLVYKGVGPMPATVGGLAGR